MNSDHLLRQLAQRVRLRLLFRNLQWFAGAFLFSVIGIFAADFLIGFGTGTLRLVALISLVSAASGFFASWLLARRVALDSIALAHLIEMRKPELAERLVTVVQMRTENGEPHLVQALIAETDEALARVHVKDVCDFDIQQCLRFSVVTTLVFTAACSIPAFRDFSYRLATAWWRPLIPFEIQVSPGSTYVLHGQSHRVTVRVLVHDDSVPAPTACQLVCKEPGAPPRQISMERQSDETYTADLLQVSRPLCCQVHAGAVQSQEFMVRVVDAPKWTAPPTLKVMPPPYLSMPSATFLFDGDAEPIMQFSRLQLLVSLDKHPVQASVVLRSSADNQSTAETAQLPVTWQAGSAIGMVSGIAQHPGEVHAELALVLEHRLSVSLPIGTWTVRADAPPRFAQDLRFHGSTAPLRTSQENPISPDDPLRLRTAVEDNEGIDQVLFEYRINDGPSHVAPWLKGDGKKKLIINEWLPLPTSLKEGDLVKFRLHASDNRNIRKGELSDGEGGPVPNCDLLPQVVTTPRANDDATAWIELRMSAALATSPQKHAEAHAAEIREIIEKIKRKVVAETDEIEKLQRSIHRQSALSPEQRKQADKLQALNQSIADDLLQAGRHFAMLPELQTLAGHFLDIRVSEIADSADALTRFGDKATPIADAEKELVSARESLKEARKKLDRMLDWNELIAKDSMDQLQIETLAKRQHELSQRLEKLLKDSQDDAENARQADTIRQDQAKLAEQTEKLKEQTQRAKETAGEKEKERIDRAAMDAEKLAKGEHGGSPAEMKDRMDKLADDLLELSQKGSDPAKAAAKDAATDLDAANKAMAAADEAKKNGKDDQAKKLNDDAAAKLAMVAKQLAKVAKSTDPKREDGEGVAEALKDGAAQMRKAENQLSDMAKDAQKAMNLASQKLAMAMREASRSANTKVPQVAQRPATRHPSLVPGGSPSSTSRRLIPELFNGQSWGELPGELKTQMLQDFRSRFGEEHAELIRAYFDRLVESANRRN